MCWRRGRATRCGLQRSGDPLVRCAACLRRRRRVCRSPWAAARRSRWGPVNPCLLYEHSVAGAPQRMLVAQVTSRSHLCDALLSSLFMRIACVWWYRVGADSSFDRSGGPLYDGGGVDDGHLVANPSLKSQLPTISLLGPARLPIPDTYNCPPRAPDGTSFLKSEAMYHRQLFDQLKSKSRYAAVGATSKAAGLLPCPAAPQF